MWLSAEQRGVMEIPLKNYAMLPKRFQLLSLFLPVSYETIPPVIVSPCSKDERLEKIPYILTLSMFECLNQNIDLYPSPLYAIDSNFMNLLEKLRGSTYTTRSIPSMQRLQNLMLCSDGTPRLERLTETTFMPRCYSSSIP